jgi:L-arabinokinase
LSAPIVFYISGHGFGHATRDIEVIRILQDLAPDLPILVSTQVPRWLFERSLDSSVTLRNAQCDTGLIQTDSLRADEGASIRRASEFYGAFDDLVARETTFLRGIGASLVVGDIPPLAFAAAAGAGIASVGIGNFTWDWIYEGFPEHITAHPALVPTIRQAYAQAATVLRLPLHGGFAGLDHVIRDIPLIARRSAHTRSECRRALDLPDGTLLLLSFGGYGLRGLNPGTPERLPGCTLVITNDASGSDLWQDRPSRDRMSRNVAQVSESDLRRLGYRYEDLVRAVDIVVTKPGYGIVSECIANDTALLYTSRGRFAEYDVLVEGMQRYTRSRFIPQEALFSGDWEPYVTKLLAEPTPEERPALDGARVAADMIVDLLSRQA